MGSDLKQILVIDDSALNRKYLEILLTANGFGVHLAVNGKEGLEKLGSIHPDLVVLDVVMPTLNGWETCLRIRAAIVNDHIPIIVMTSKNTPVDMLQSFEVGANEFISKPIDEAELLATVNRLLKRDENSSVDKQVG
ncbi:MAG: response regulator [Elusimicrobiota bacterium]